MNTTSEMIEIIKAYDAGKPIQYTDTNGEVEEDWKDKDTYTFNFTAYTYRIKPNPKFKVGDKVVLISNEGKACPPISSLTKLYDDTVYLSYYGKCSLQELHTYYINIEDVLWYFETYDYTTKKWGLVTAWRFTIKEADKEFASSHHITKWRPMYALGFALNENK